MTPAESEILTTYCSSLENNNNWCCVWRQLSLVFISLLHNAYLYLRATADPLDSGKFVAMSLVVICDPEPSLLRDVRDQTGQLLGLTTKDTFATSFATHFCCNANCSSLMIKHMQTKWSLVLYLDKFSVSLHFIGDLDN